MAPPAVESRFGSHLITGALIGFGLCLLALALLDRPSTQGSDPGPGPTVTGSTTTDGPPATGFQPDDPDDEQSGSSGDRGFLAWRDLTLSDLVTGLVGICSAVLGVLNYRRSRRAEEADDEEWRGEEAYL